MNSPTVLERIRRAAMGQAYDNARRLGFEPVAAYRESVAVAEFINTVAGVRLHAGVDPYAVE